MRFLTFVALLALTAQYGTGQQDSARASNMSLAGYNDLHHVSWAPDWQTRHPGSPCLRRFWAGTACPGNGRSAPRVSTSSHRCRR